MAFNSNNIEEMHEAYFELKRENAALKARIAQLEAMVKDAQRVLMLARGRLDADCSHDIASEVENCFYRLKNEWVVVSVEAWPTTDATGWRAFMPHDLKVHRESVKDSRPSWLVIPKEQGK